MIHPADLGGRSLRGPVSWPVPQTTDSSQSTPCRSRQARAVANKIFRLLPKHAPASLPPCLPFPCLARKLVANWDGNHILIILIEGSFLPEADRPKLTGTVEVDETYVGGKPRLPNRGAKRGRGTEKTPVFAAVERGGKIRRRVVADVRGETLKDAIREEVDSQSRIVSDDFQAYKGIGKEFAGGHSHVAHGTWEYVRGDIHTNTAESSFALVKRGIMGVYHNVSKKYLHRYIWQFDFMWNNRGLNDGERTAELIRVTEGKRLMYKAPTGATE
jgi:transposase-like protein